MLMLVFRCSRSRPMLTFAVSWHHVGNMSGAGLCLARDGTLGPYAQLSSLQRERKRGSLADQLSEFHHALPAWDKFNGGLPLSCCLLPLSLM